MVEDIYFFYNSLSDRDKYIKVEEHYSNNKNINLANSSVLKNDWIFSLVNCCAWKCKVQKVTNCLHLMLLVLHMVSSASESN